MRFPEGTDTRPLLSISKCIEYKHTAFGWAAKTLKKSPDENRGYDLNQKTWGFCSCYEITYLVTHCFCLLTITVRHFSPDTFQAL